MAMMWMGMGRGRRVENRGGGVGGEFGEIVVVGGDRDW